MIIYLLITLWIWWSELLPVSPISHNNEMRQEAQLAYQTGNYAKALPLYTQLSRNTTSIDPAVRLNLGHTYFQLKQYANAKPQYEALLQSDRPDLRTVAATQLGVMACLQGDSATALALFEQALLENPNNEPARYNFEVIKTFFSGKTPPTTPKTKSSVLKPVTKANSRPTGSQQVERSDRQDELLRRFQRLNLSEEQALQLLDALQEDDLPYALARPARHEASQTGKGNRW